MRLSMMVRSLPAGFTGKTSISAAVLPTAMAGGSGIQIPRPSATRRNTHHR
ncbi:MAG: hypothetical protein RBS49_04320 [Sphaerochaeta sp.]|nr:hypothetical protein [Sphaerochaeta sp.]MDX9915096.1 hypothetical protein [Sphaerochaeta sp.]